MAMGWASLARIVDCRLKWGLPRSIVRRLVPTRRAAVGLTVVLRSSGFLVLVILACVGVTPAPASSQTAAAARCELPNRRCCGAGQHRVAGVGAVGGPGVVRRDRAGRIGVPRVSRRHTRGGWRPFAADGGSPAAEGRCRAGTVAPGGFQCRADVFRHWRGATYPVPRGGAVRIAGRALLGADATNRVHSPHPASRRSPEDLLRRQRPDVPSKNFYGLEEVAAEVKAGWQYWAVLHNHTVRTLDGRPALGMPAPSTSDVQLFKGLVENLGLREVWITNGMYTGVVSSENLGQFNTRQ